MDVLIKNAKIIDGSGEPAYFGSVGIKNIRHTLVAAIAADLTAMLLSAVTVRLFLS